MSLQALLHRAIVGQTCCRLVNHYDIETGKQFLVMPERFSNRSLYTVSCGRLAAVFFGNCETKPWFTVNPWVAIDTCTGQYCK